MKQVTCPYCQADAVLTTGKEVYPHRFDLRGIHFYVCRPCDARVGCHGGTTNPLGRLANAELRKLKMEAHAAFDPIWLNNVMKRKDAYKWLSEQLGIPAKDTHIGMFDEDTCRKVVEVCKEVA